MQRLLYMLLLIVFIVSCNKRPRKNSAYYMNLGSEPTTLHVVNSTDSYASTIHDHTVENLLSKNLDTYEWEPALATEWKISEDKKVFTFKLRKGVKWHDGKDFTAEDVKFSFEAIFSDKFKAAVKRSYFEGIDRVEVVDPHTVKFITKDKSYKNFTQAAGGLRIIPKHFYDFSKKKSFYNKNIVGTGPYKIAIYKRASRIVLEKNKDWWGNSIHPNRWTFPKIVMRFVGDRNVALEMLKKGSLDFLGIRPDEYVKKTSGPLWGKEVHKVKTENSYPKGYNFIGWNLKHPILKDKRVRKALYHLVNRRLMIEKFEYGYTVPLTGPVYPQSPYALKAKIVEYEPKKALSMLRQAGWRDTDGDNILDKVINGKKKKLSITILEPWEGFLKYLTVFKEDAKKVGVDINIKVMEWNSFIKLIDERKFDAVRLAWSALIDWDPTQIWHSKSIKGGSNFISFSNKRVDQICEEAKYIHDKEKRIKLLKEAQKIIIEEAPYVWFTNKASTMYGYRNRLKREKDTYKYGVGNSFWKFKSEMRESI